VGAELQKREQELGYAQQALAQQLQQQGGVEMDSLVSEVFIKSYGRKGYSISCILEMNILYADRQHIEAQLKNAQRHRQLSIVNLYGDPKTYN
jgi:hypothetical protein